MCFRSCTERVLDVVNCTVVCCLVVSSRLQSRCFVMGCGNWFCRSASNHSRSLSFCPTASPFVTRWTYSEISQRRGVSRASRRSSSACNFASRSLADLANRADHSEKRSRRDSAQVRRRSFLDGSANPCLELHCCVRSDPARRAMSAFGPGDGSCSRASWSVMWSSFLSWLASCARISSSFASAASSFASNLDAHA